MADEKPDTTAGPGEPSALTRGGLAAMLSGLALAGLGRFGRSGFDFAKRKALMSGLKGVSTNTISSLRRGALPGRDVFQSMGPWSWLRNVEPHVDPAVATASKIGQPLAFGGAAAYAGGSAYDAGRDFVNRVLAPAKPDADR